MIRRRSHDLDVWVAVAVLIAALPPGAAVAQGNPAIQLTCSGKAAVPVHSLPPLRCAWTTTNASYVVIVGASQEYYGVSGVVTLDADMFSGRRPYFIFAVGDTGITMTSVGRTITTTRLGGGNAVAYVADIDLVGNVSIAPFRRVVEGQLTVRGVGLALIAAMQSHGFVVVTDSTNLVVVDNSADLSAMSIITANPILHDQLCDPQQEADCAVSARDRRIERRVSLAARVSRARNGVLMEITPAVVARYRREGGPFRSDTAAAALAEPLSVNLFRQVEAAVRQPR